MDLDFSTSCKETDSKPNTVMPQNPDLWQETPQQLMQQQPQHQCQPTMPMGEQMPRQTGVLGGPQNPVLKQEMPEQLMQQQPQHQCQSTMPMGEQMPRQTGVLGGLQNPVLKQETPEQLMQQQPQHQCQPTMPMGEQMPRQTRVLGGPVNQSGPHKVYKQLVQILENPTLDKLNQVLQIVGSNPPIMAEFNRQWDLNFNKRCKQKNNHPHHIKNLGLVDGSSQANAKQANPQEARELKIQACIQTLMHLCQCKNVNCHLTKCLKMKIVVIHSNVCKRKIKGGCPICKHLVAFCCYHAKYCQDTKCPAAFCRIMKHKLRQAQLLEECMAIIKPRTTGPRKMQSVQQSSNVAMSTTVTVKQEIISPTNSPSPHQPGSD